MKRRDWCQPDMFPEFSTEGVRALRSPKCPKQIAMVKICALLAKIFRRPDDPAGGSAVVDAIRLFGGAFSNSARKMIAVAAGVHTRNRLPDDLLPLASAVDGETLSIVRRLRPLFVEAIRLLDRMAEEGK